MQGVVLSAVLAMPASTTGVTPAVGMAPPPPPRLPAPHKIRTQSELPPMERLEDGSLRHVDTDARFVAVIRPDGQVTMRDLSTVGFEASVTGFRVVDWTLGLARAISRPNRHDRPDLETPQSDPEDPQDQAEEAAEMLPPQPYGSVSPIIGLKFTFGGIADRVLRKGQRRRTKAKKEFLAATAPLRDAMATDRARNRQRSALLGLGQQLAALWRDDSRNLSARKQALFELWDECDESSPGDDAMSIERAEGAEQMRRRIEKFIRQVAPRGSEDAFSEGELSRFNASRHSHQRFDPYRPPDDPPTQTRDASEPEAPREQ